MYKSGLTAKAFVDALEEEADVSIPIPRAAWYRWLTAVEQFVYTEVLKEYVSAKIRLDDVPVDAIPLSLLPVPPGAAAPVYDDILSVYDEAGREVAKGGAVSVFEFPEKFLWKTDYNGRLILSGPRELEAITVIYRLRPEIKTEANADALEVALPPEHLDMAAAKMRGEAYKLANEDGIAGKWLADYNQAMENFKVWAIPRNERYGK